MHFLSEKTPTIAVAIFTTVLGLTLLSVNSPKVNANGCPTCNPTPTQVTICHATSSSSNPYVSETVNKSSLGDGSGHGNSGINSGDIVPPTPGTNFPNGQNWTTQGQAIWANGCVVTHNACNSDNQCVKVNGVGSNSCATNQDCQPHHLACVDNMCKVVSGTGTNSCSNDDDCDEETPHHNACNPDLHICTQFPGPGPSTCTTNADCQPVVDQCINIPGIQATVPTNMQTNSDHVCSCITGFHSVNDGEGGFTCAADPTVTPSPIQTPSNPGGPGDGRSDGKSDGLSSCPSCTQAPQTQVLGASTGPTQAVLGASTMAGTGTFENTLMDIMFVAGTIILGAGIKSYAKEKNN